MKIGLIDIDSKMPNLALMKLSAYFKNLGHEVELTSPLFADGYDEAFASKIFTYSEMPILPDTAIVGGSGYSLDSWLDEDIEAMMPDYSLYNCDYAIGFTTRGCNRECPFCIVPKKEGNFHIVGDIYGFWQGQKRLMLLDNSLNTDEDHFLMICGQIEKEKISVDFNQGLDIRHLTDIQAEALSELKLWGQTPLRFAWDLMENEPFVRHGIHILYHHKLLSKTMFYVLIGFNTTEEEDLYRIETLRGLKTEPFVMPYDKFNKYQKSLTRWVNHKAIFKSVKWEDYKYKKSLEEMPTEAK